MRSDRAEATQRCAFDVPAGTVPDSVEELSSGAGR
jgi:hypothetical protein